MALTRLWLVLVCVAAALAVSLVLLLPQPLQAELDEQAGARLARAQQATALFLKVNARQWMDTAAHDATDAVLVEALEQANRGPADLGILHKTVQERLRVFAEKAKADLVLATDAHGRVLARTGLDDAAYKDGIEGFPLVGDALRGLRGDDTWSLEGKLYRVAASPVMAPGRYAGALVMGQEVGAELAQSLKQLLEVEVAFLLRGRVIATSSTLPVAPQLPMAATERAAEMDKGGHTPPVAMGAGDGRYLLVLAPFVGEAAGHQAVYALLLARPASANLAQLANGLGAGDWKALPWATLWPVGAVLLAVLLIGFVLVHWEGRRPIDRLLRETQQLARGETPRLQDALHAGPLAAVARAVNTTLDRLGTAPPHQPLRVDLPLRPKLSPDLPLPAPVLPPREPEPVVESATAFVDEYSGPTTIERLPLPRAPHPEHTPVAPLPLLASLQQEMLPGGHDLASSEEESTRVVPPDVNQLLADEAAAEAEEPVDPLGAELRAVYQEFVETKQSCGENTDGLSYDKFAVKLRANREQLLAKYNCRGVRFQVYIKDGKAALKATPVS